MDYCQEKLINATEDELENLCIQFIEILNNLRNDGKISEEEYYGHIKIKEEYVEYRNKEKSIIR